jgi:NADPH-dependent 2,4-dienoyl-CoA reductase/sulfur reductase-like enzyme
VELDFENHQVSTAATLTATPDQVFDYDYLVLATGSRAFRPEIINSHGKYVQTMKDLADGKALKKLADNPQLKSVAVIGGGYIGVETAEALAKAGKTVTIYHSGTQLLTGFYDTEIVELLQNRLIEKGVKLVLGSRVNNIDDIEADAFLFSLGFRPNSELGSDKIERLPKVNCYKVDQFQRTSIPNVYAIGDCASSLNNVTGEPAYFALGSNTATTALVCAHHILGIDTPNLGRQGANAIEIFDLKLCSVGFTLESARAHGFNALSTTCSDRVKQDDFTTNNDQVTISVVYDQTSHRLLGVQIASFTDVSPILHMFSLAIQEGLTLERIK